MTEQPRSRAHYRQLQRQAAIRRQRRIAAGIAVLVGLAVLAWAGVSLAGALGASDPPPRFASGISAVEPAAKLPPLEPVELAAKAQPLKQTSVKNGTGKYIALTIDDGYGYQPAMLALLKSYNVKCTTFILGSWASTHKAEVKAMADAGFEIANHSWDHKSFTSLSAEEISSQLSRTEAVLSGITGKRVPYMRPPGGNTNAAVKAAVEAAGYTQIMWSKTFGDSGQGVTPEIAYNNVMVTYGAVKGGDIILCHWGSKNTLEAMKRVIPELQAQGFTFVTVSELRGESY